MRYLAALLFFLCVPAFAAHDFCDDVWKCRPECPHLHLCKPHTMQDPKWQGMKTWRVCFDGMTQEIPVSPRMKEPDAQAWLDYLAASCR